jgi:hypothetical protein
MQVVAWTTTATGAAAEIRDGARSAYRDGYFTYAPASTGSVTPVT